MTEDKELKAQLKYEFKRRLEELREFTGRGTELISLYIPPDKQISDVVAQLRDEHGQAANIKSKSTRTNVQSALESVMARLKYIPRPPPTGVVIFCGAIDIGSDRTDLRTTVLEPPEPIQSYRYHCDSQFYLEPLEDLLREKKTYGLLVLDRREATVGTLRGKHIDVHRHMTSNVPGKQRKGGQSSRRFQRLREIAIDEFYQRIGDRSSDIFLNIPRKDLEGIIIGGPSPTKEEFIDGEYLHHELQQKIVGAYDISYTDESGLFELVDAASDTMLDLELIKEKKLMERFFKELVKDNGLAAYGEDEVRQNLQMGAVDTLLLSEDLRRERVTLRCTQCAYTEERTWVKRPGEPEPEPGPCPKCKGGMIIVERVDLVSELSTTADQMGTTVAFISSDFEEGEQLTSAFGGVAAILRFRTGI